MKTLNLKNKNVTVMGLGSLGGGVGTVKFLVKEGAEVLVTDLKPKKDLTESLRQLKGLPVKYVLGKHRVTDFASADLVVKNPGVPNKSKYLAIARTNDVPIENDAGLFFQLCPVPIIGVTGSKGKSTTVALINSMLKKRGYHVVLVGHNKTSVLDRITLIKKKSIVLFELSSWRLEGLKKIQQSPWLSVITNVVPDHLNTYHNMREYQNAKKIIFQFQSKKDYVILNKENQYTNHFGSQVKSKRFWFSIKSFGEQNGAYIKNKQIYFRKDGKESAVATVEELKLLGMHNLENILAATLVAKILKVSNSDIRKALGSFKGMPDRLEYLRKVNNVSFYNDSAATIPDAAIASIKSFSQKIILIAGGQDKCLDYRQLAQVVKQRVKYLFLLPGTATNELIKSLSNFSKTKNCSSLKEAVGAAQQTAKDSDIILFSPGAASFNLFKNEFDRGEQFRKLVNLINAQR